MSTVTTPASVARTQGQQQHGAPQASPLAIHPAVHPLPGAPQQLPAAAEISRALRSAAAERLYKA